MFTDSDRPLLSQMLKIIRSIQSKPKHQNINSDVVKVCRILVYRSFWIYFKRFVQLFRNQVILLIVNHLTRLPNTYLCNAPQILITKPNRRKKSKLMKMKTSHREMKMFAISKGDFIITEVEKTSL